MNKVQTCRWLFLPILMGGAALTPPGVLAQSDVPSRPISISSEAPIQTVLRTLFKAAGIRNFVIDMDVQGNVNISLSDVPFPVALKQVLGASNPPLTSAIEDRVYHIRVQPPPTISVNTPAIEGLAMSAEDADQSRFYKIGVKHYDAGVMADLITRRDGIIVVPPNFVVPAGTNASLTRAAPTVTAVSPQTPLGPGVTVPFDQMPATTGPASASAATNILPDGVKRIYALESNNSLVIEATPRGLSQLPLETKELNP